MYVPMLIRRKEKCSKSWVSIPMPPSWRAEINTDRLVHEPSVAPSFCALWGSLLIPQEALRCFSESVVPLCSVCLAKSLWRQVLVTVFCLTDRNQHNVATGAKNASHIRELNGATEASDGEIRMGFQLSDDSLFFLQVRERKLVFS
jgi:hypothetical protein